MNNDRLKASYTENRVVRAICDHMAKRQRNQTETKLDRLILQMTNDGFTFERSEVIAALRSLEEAGCGTYIVGRRGRPSRFLWDVQSLHVSKVAKGPEDLEGEPVPVVMPSPVREEDAVNVEIQSQPESDDEDVVEGADEGDLDHSGDTATVVIQKNDRSLAELERWYRDGRLILDPEWQRNYVWSVKAASRLIESFLIDLPVPVIYLACNDEGTYEVIDGLQRLTSVFNFFDGNLKLTGLEIRRDLNSKTYKDLNRPLQNKIRDATIRTFELAPNTSKDLMFVIFERLNSGGTALNDMEIRNCLYRGSLNSLIKELANTDDLKTCVNQANIEKRMTDRLLVLRFLAFYERTYLKATKGLKKFLNDFLEEYREPLESKLQEFEQQFKKAMRSAVTIFGQYGFRLRKSDSKKTSQWTPRVNAAVFQVVATSLTAYDVNHVTR